MKYSLRLEFEQLKDARGGLVFRVHVTGRRPFGQGQTPAAAVADLCSRWREVFNEDAPIGQGSLYGGETAGVQK